MQHVFGGMIVEEEPVTANPEHAKSVVKFKAGSDLADAVQ